MFTPVCGIFKQPMIVPINCFQAIFASAHFISSSNFATIWYANFSWAIRWQGIERCLQIFRISTYEWDATKCNRKILRLQITSLQDGNGQQKLFVFRLKSMRFLLFITNSPQWVQSGVWNSPSPLLYFFKIVNNCNLNELTAWDHAAFPFEMN